MGKIIIEKDLDGIKDLSLIIPTVHEDERGYFMETFNRKDMSAAGIDLTFVQDNQCLSTKGVLRGLHFQKQYPQAKMIRVVIGTVFDVAVDLRPGSTTYGRWHGELLSGENKKQLLIPRGFAHGYLVLSETAVFCYKCDDFYHPNDEGGIAWNDPEIGIKWPGLEGVYQGSPDPTGYKVSGTPLILSEKDRNWGNLKNRS